MSPYPILNAKDRLIARMVWRLLIRYRNRAEHPKLRSSLSQWGMMLRETLKNTP